jgi:hypothetical protein
MRSVERERDELRLSARARSIDSRADGAGSPMEESDIRGELLMATASKDTLLQSMRDIHDATCRGILPATVNLRIRVGPNDQERQAIKFALHRDVCESLVRCSASFIRDPAESLMSISM